MSESQYIQGDTLNELESTAYPRNIKCTQPKRINIPYNKFSKRKLRPGNIGGRPGSYVLQYEYV